MLEITPQERLALAVTALLLAAGAGARVVADWELIGGGHVVEVSGDSAGQPPRAEVAAHLADEEVRSRPLGDGERIDPNTASVLELQRLPRVGPALAGRIVAHREKHGSFRSLADLDEVAGVGPALLAGLTPRLTLPAAPPVLPGAGAAAASISPPGTAAGAVTPDAAPASGERVYINRADARELQALPGIGPALADRIVAWRAQNGRFSTAADLEKVPGIGPRMRERLEPRVRFDP